MIAHPVKDGAVVWYWYGIRDGKTKATGKAKVISVGEIGGTKVVWLEGVRGCIALSHVEPVEKDQGK